MNEKKYTNSMFNNIKSWKDNHIAIEDIKNASFFDMIKDTIVSLEKALSKNWDSLPSENDTYASWSTIYARNEEFAIVFDSQRQLMSMICKLFNLKSNSNNRIHIFNLLRHHDFSTEENFNQFCENINHIPVPEKNVKERPIKKKNFVVNKSGIEKKSPKTLLKQESTTIPSIQDDWERFSEKNIDLSSKQPVVVKLKKKTRTSNVSQKSKAKWPISMKTWRRLNRYQRDPEYEKTFRKELKISDDHEIYKDMEKLWRDYQLQKEYISILEMTKEAFDIFKFYSNKYDKNDNKANENMLNRNFYKILWSLRYFFKTNLLPYYKIVEDWKVLGTDETYLVLYKWLFNTKIKKKWLGMKDDWVQHSLISEEELHLAMRADFIWYFPKLLLKILDSSKVSV